MTVIRRPSTARLFAFATALAIAFTQVALAGFACPILGSTPQAMHEAMGEGHCDRAADPGAKILCAKTCQGEPQKRDAPSLDVPPLSLDAGLRMEMRDLHLALAALPPPPDRRHATSPPARLQYVRFLN